MDFSEGMMFENKFGTIIEVLKIDGCYVHIIDNIDDTQKMVLDVSLKNHLKEFGFKLAK